MNLPLSNLSYYFVPDCPSQKLSTLAVRFEKYNHFYRDIAAEIGSSDGSIYVNPLCSRAYANELRAAYHPPIPAIPVGWMEITDLPFGLTRPVWFGRETGYDPYSTDESLIIATSCSIALVQMMGVRLGQSIRLREQFHHQGRPNEE